MPQKQPREHEVVIDKLVHGGQGLGTLADGKKALVWNVLPGENIRFSERKSKSSFVEGVAIEIIEAAEERVEPRDALYLSTSPWQMMTYEAENHYKQAILVETLERGGAVYDSEIIFHAPQDPWQYRNKMEYSFYGDEAGLHLALYNRGTHRKQIVEGSSIARSELDEAARRIRDVLATADVRASELKSLIVRCDQQGTVAAALFTRNEELPKIDALQETCQGIIVCFSNPKSPASVLTRELYRFGEISLHDRILGTGIGYDVLSFFQVNIPIFTSAVGSIDAVISNRPLVDFYGGTGAIGLSLSGTEVIVDSDPHSIKWARHNASTRQNLEVVHASAEQALDYIPGDKAIVVDPPRAGLHTDVTTRLLENVPPTIVYLSCNPSTQARDLALLQAKYRIRSLAGYNFFPRTPHIESLAILERNP